MSSCRIDDEWLTTGRWANGEPARLHLHAV